MTGRVHRVGGDAHDRPALSTPRVPSSDMTRTRVATPFAGWFIASMGTVGGGPGRARTRTGPVREARPDHESAESAAPGCAPSTGAVRDVQCAARPTAAERHALLPRPEPGRRSARPSCPVPGRRCPGVAGTGPPPGALGRGRPGVGRRRSGGAEALALRERVYGPRDAGSATDVPSHGIALLSRFPVRVWRARRLAPAPLGMPLRMAGRPGLTMVRDQPRAALAAVLEGPGGPFTAVAVHLSFVPGWNIRQLLAVRGWIADLPSPHVLLGHFKPGRRPAQGRTRRAPQGPHRTVAPRLAGSGPHPDLSRAPSDRAVRPCARDRRRRERGERSAHTGDGDLGPSPARAGTVPLNLVRSARRAEYGAGHEAGQGRTGRYRGLAGAARGRPQRPVRIRPVR